MAEDDTGVDAAAGENMQSGPVIPNENNSASHNDSDDDWVQVSSGGSSNDLNSDLDSHTGRRASRRARIQDSNRVEREVESQGTGYQGPETAYQIEVARLYAKAAKQNPDLTDDERVLLLSRGDVFGKALAHPDSLTIQEMYQVMYWPPPDEMRALIQRATGGALSTPGELIAKAREAIERGRLQEDLNDEEVRLITQRFWDQPPRWFLNWGNDGCPGNEEATSLVCSRLGVDLVVVDKVRSHQARARKSGGAYLDAIVINNRRLQERLECGEVGTGEFLNLYSRIVARLKTVVRAANGGEAQLSGMVNDMARLQERLEHGEVEHGELVALNRGYVDSLRELREDSSEARVQARPKPQPTPSEVEARPVEDDEDEERVDAIAKSMTDLWVKMEGGQVDKEEFIQRIRGYVSGLEALRASDKYLDAILAAMAHLGEEFDNKTVDQDEYIKRFWAYLVPLGNFRENRRYCRKAGGGPVLAGQPGLIRPFEQLFWADHYAKFASLNLSREDLKSEVRRRFNALSESQSQAYRERGYLTSSHESGPYVHQVYPWVKSLGAKSL
ncbi:hypothetical protein CONLIGDRAFT_632212 [Coniochaeta ligniaria NRRL 30616]|uniref:Uncharacterized protein n=1 Tax=Coniochaeta ligniaria NRRL 30616 TaxID=1408157 RepID=A0A1J7JA08_9PEZI|nr:hypothetical protein CONLIGDRAFT_632212 [Coniochaeta ligniaria NRRL 30616]